MSEGAERGQMFYDLHQPGRPLFLPNAWDYASAAALLRAGYPAIGTTSLGVAAAAGKADADGQTRAETLALAGRLGSLPALLTVDIEAGFSDDPRSVAEFAAQVAGTGAVGVNIEDGRPDGTLTPAAEHCAKVAAVKDLVPELFVNARTDAFWLASRGSWEPEAEAISRGIAYVAAGADGVFVPAAAAPGTVAALAARIPAPLNVLYLPGQHSLASLAAAGVARVSTGSYLFRVALQAMLRAAATASERDDGADRQVPSYGDIQELITARPPSDIGGSARTWTAPPGPWTGSAPPLK
jgi:2-methylisocitrate lyase-like PEP mutase family enzyme